MWWDPQPPHLAAAGDCRNFVSSEGNKFLAVRRLGSWGYHTENIMSVSRWMYPWYEGAEGSCVAGTHKRGTSLYYRGLQGRAVGERESCT